MLKRDEQSCRKFDVLAAILSILHRKNDFVKDLKI